MNEDEGRIDSNLHQKDEDEGRINSKLINSEGRRKDEGRINSPRKLEKRFLLLKLREGERIQGHELSIIQGRRTKTN